MEYKYEYLPLIVKIKALELFVSFILGGVNPEKVMALYRDDMAELGSLLKDKTQEKFMHDCLYWHKLALFAEKISGIKFLDETYNAVRMLEQMVSNIPPKMYTELLEESQSFLCFLNFNHDPDYFLKQAMPQLDPCWKNILDDEMVKKLGVLTPE